MSGHRSTAQSAVTVSAAYDATVMAMVKGRACAVRACAVATCGVVWLVAVVVSRLASVQLSSVSTFVEAPLLHMLAIDGEWARIDGGVDVVDGGDDLCPVGGAGAPSTLCSALASIVSVAMSKIGRRGKAVRYPGGSGGVHY